VKCLKKDKRSHLSVEKTGKQAVLYSTMCIQEAMIKIRAMEKIDAQDSILMGIEENKKGE
jgi:hypothetical protein